MVSGEVCCRDVLVQIAAIRAANNKAGALLLKNFAKNCMIADNSEDTSKNVDRLVSTLLLFLRSSNSKEKKANSENLKEEIVKKLQEIQGQVEGIEKMIQYDSCYRKSWFSLLLLEKILMKWGIIGGKLCPKLLNQ